MDTEEKEKTKELPFRFRPMLLLAAACFVGALFAYLQTATQTGFILTAIFIIIAVFVAFAFRKKGYVIIAVLLAVIVNIVAAVQFDIRSPLAFSNANALVSGRVAAVGMPSEKYEPFTIMDVVINGVPQDQMLSLKLFSKEGISEGDHVTFRGKCQAVSVTESSYALGLIAKNIGYIAEADKLLEKTRGEPNFFEKIKARIVDAMLSVMPKDDAGISLSLLFGDLELLSMEDFQMTKASGTLHMFSVSGLHVGFLVAAAVFILKKLKANRYVLLAVTALLLLIYGSLCGFPASFNRSAVMSIALLLSYVFCKRYDALSALSFSAVIILLFDPLSLFTVGFQMSFAAILGTTLLYRPIKAVTKKVLRFEGLTSSVALSLSATIGIYPVTAAYFGTFSTYFIFSNFIIVPLVGVAYLTLFAAAIPALIAPSVFSFLYYPALGLVRLLAALTTFFGGLPGSLILVSPLSYGALGYYLAIAFLSSCCVYTRKKRWTAAAISAALGLVLFAISLLG